MADFEFGLNTSTIRPADLRQKIELAGEAGYDAIELWIDDVEKYIEGGGSLADVRKWLDDQGLKRPSMICLRDWCQADDQAFAKAFETAKRRLDIAGKLGVVRIVASPPREKVSLAMATDRYGKILDQSIMQGVPASVEFLGFVEGINTLEDAWAICAGTGMAEATVTPDVWHIYRGGSNIATLDDIPADHISCFHWNDAPKEPPRLEQNDSHRVYPGDGIVNLKEIADKLRKKDFQGCLTLELFNPSYWMQDPLEVAKTGLAKMKASVA
ncbi:MAG: sugar phosphate isomerase/epimerase family protein [Planctomycetota bacterium]